MDPTNYRIGPKWTEMDRNGHINGNRNGLKGTEIDTEIDQNRIQQAKLSSSPGAVSGHGVLGA